MKLIKILPILLFFTSLTFYGQSESMQNKKDKIKALKVAFLTTELDLTSKEAQKFWPIYNTYDDSQFDLRHRKTKSYLNQLNTASFDKMSERDAASLLSKIESAENELYLLRKKYTDDLREVLPAIKILKLKKAEDDFNRKLLHQYRDRAKK